MHEFGESPVAAFARRDLYFGPARLQRLTGLKLPDFCEVFRPAGASASGQTGSDYTRQARNQGAGNSLTVTPLDVIRGFLVGRGNEKLGGIAMLDHLAQ